MYLAKENVSLSLQRRVELLYLAQPTPVSSFFSFLFFSFLFLACLLCASLELTAYLYTSRLTLLLFFYLFIYFILFFPIRFPPPLGIADPSLLPAQSTALSSTLIVASPLLFSVHLKSTTSAPFPFSLASLESSLLPRTALRLLGPHPLGLALPALLLISPATQGLRHRSPVASEVGGGRNSSTSSSLHTEESAPHVGGELLLRYEAMPPPRQPILRVVITGGPCSGKSTCTSFFKAELERLGYQVFCLPEVATMLMTAGARLWLTLEEEKAERIEMAEKSEKERLREDYCRSALRVLPPTPPTAPREDLPSGLKRPVTAAAASLSGATSRRMPAAFSSGLSSSNTEADNRSELKELLQRRVLQNMLVHEDTFMEFAQGFNRPAVLLMDRGTLDGSAYCTRSDWESILANTNYAEEELVEARYDAVLHFVTAADGAEKFYTLINNGTRHETREEAVEQDGMTRRAWRSFPLVMVIDNSTDFQLKLERAMQQLRQILPPTSLEERYTQKSVAEMMQRRNSNPNTAQREVRLAQLHTGSVYFAARDGPTPPQRGVQRFIAVEKVDWCRMPRHFVTTKKVSQYFIIPDADSCETREVEQLVRLVGNTGVFRPVYLRRARFRTQPGGVLPVLVPRISTRRDTASPKAAVAPRLSSSQSQEPRGSTPKSSPNRNGSQHSLQRLGTGTPCPPKMPNIFEATCRLTEREFHERIQHSTPAMPLVEKEVFRFIHKLTHLTLIRFDAPEEMKGRLVIAGPAAMSLGDLPEWIQATPLAYDDSWISHEIPNLSLDNACHPALNKKQCTVPFCFCSDTSPRCPRIDPLADCRATESSTTYTALYEQERWSEMSVPLKEEQTNKQTNNQSFTLNTNSTKPIRNRSVIAVLCTRVVEHLFWRCSELSSSVRICFYCQRLPPPGFLHPFFFSFAAPSLLPRGSIPSHSLHNLPLYHSDRMQRCAAVMMRRRGIGAVLATATASTPLCSSAVRLPLRFQAEKPSTGEGHKMPDGYRVDPDPKGTYFMLNQLPVIYFCAFWAAVILGVKFFFFSNGDRRSDELREVKEREGADRAATRPGPYGAASMRYVDTANNYESSLPSAALTHPCMNHNIVVFFCFSPFLLILSLCVQPEWRHTVHVETVNHQKRTITNLQTNGSTLRLELEWLFAEPSGDRLMKDGRADDCGVLYWEAFKSALPSSHDVLRPDTFKSTLDVPTRCFSFFYYSLLWDGHTYFYDPPRGPPQRFFTDMRSLVASTRPRGVRPSPTLSASRRWLNGTGSAPTRQELLDALDCLNLSPHCSDEDVKSSFRRLARLHHPDVAAGSSSGTEAMTSITAAYRLLQQTTPESREAMLRGSPGGRASRFTGQSDFTYSSEEYNRAMRAYRGRKAPTAAGDSRTASFNLRHTAPTDQGGLQPSRQAPSASPHVSERDVEKLRAAQRAYNCQRGGRPSQDQLNYTPWINEERRTRVGLPSRRMRRIGRPLLVAFCIGSMCWVLCRKEWITAHRSFELVLCLVSLQQSASSCLFLSILYVSVSLQFAVSNCESIAQLFFLASTPPVTVNCIPVKADQDAAVPRMRVATLGDQPFPNISPHSGR
eukprot:gene2247-1407_t